MQRNHRVLITGASGTLGYNVARLLAKDPSTQLVLPLRTPQPGLFHNLANTHLRQLNMADPSYWNRILSDMEPTAVIHCAATGVRPGRRESWFEMLTFNVENTLRMFEATLSVKHCHFIYVSSGLIYRSQGRPLCENDPVGTVHPYGASKLAADSLLQATAAEFGRDLTVIRPFSFTGVHDGGERLFPSLLRSAAARTPFPLSSGQQIRDFCAVQDIAEAMRLILDSKREQTIEVFNIGSGDSTTLRELVEGVCKDLALDLDLQFGARPYSQHEPMHLVADIAKARALNWTPATNLSFAVWELARMSFPDLTVRRPHPTR